MLFLFFVDNSGRITAAEHPARFAAHTPLLLCFGIWLHRCHRDRCGLWDRCRLTAGFKPMRLPSFDTVKKAICQLSVAFPVPYVARMGDFVGDYLL